MTGLVAWLARRPIFMAVVTAALVAGFVYSLASVVRGGPRPPTTPRTDAPVARYTLPASTQRPPRQRVEEAGRALHALGRACRTPVTRRSPARLRRPLDVLESFVADFPSGRFRIDGEPGTAMALLIVVWNQLGSCDPTLAAEVEDRIPARYRGG